MLKKLRAKFVLINMVIVAAMLIVIFGLVFRFTAESLEQESTAILQQLSQPAAPGEPGTDDIPLPHFALQITPRGYVTASGRTSFDLTDTEFLQMLLDTVYSDDSPMGEIEDYHLRYYRTASVNGQSIAFVDVSSQEATLNVLVQISVVVGLFSLAAFWGISILLARWAIKPVEKAWQQQRQFVSDASHELKTPLTVIMSNAELLQSPECDEANRERFAENILTMSGQMRNLVEGLLELARADNGQVKKSFARLDMSTLVCESLLPFEPMYFERGLALESQVEPGILLNGSEQYLHQVVDILLDNALKYSDSGTVRLLLRRQGSHQCLLAVASPGEPIPREDLQRIFERFYRVDQARTRTGSFGLGLSIAKSVVTEHGGKIWAESKPGGNCFFVLLPTL